MKPLYLFCLVFAFACTDNSSRETATSASSRSYDTSGVRLSWMDSLHQRRTFKIYDKSLIEYIDSKPNRPDSIRKIIYLLPLGNMKAETEEIIQGEVEYLKKFFQLEVRLMDRVPFNEIKNQKVKTRFVPANDYSYYGKIKGHSVDFSEQIEANSLIENYIRQNKPKDAVALLGITEQDIYVPSMNFIYGTSYLKDGIGVISAYRITDYPEEGKANIRKVMTKQIANLFSIPNVKDYKCVMNFHNDIYQLQAGVFYLSPRALEKLKYDIGFDYEKRFKELKDFWKSEKDKQMEGYYSKCIKCYQATKPIPLSCGNAIIHPVKEINLPFSGTICHDNSIPQGIIHYDKTFYAKLKLIPGDCEIPQLATYKLDGTIIDSIVVTTGKCYNDCGYYCHEQFSINESLEFVSRDTITEYDCSTRNEDRSFKKVSVCELMGMINKEGKIITKDLVVRKIEK